MTLPSKDEVQEGTTVEEKISGHLQNDLKNSVSLIKNDKQKGKEDQDQYNEEEKDLEEEGPYYPDGGFQAYLMLFGCFISLIATLGITSANGAIENYIQLSVLPEESALNISWIFAVFNYAAFASLLLLSPLFDQVGARVMFITSWILYGIGFMCFSVSNKLYQLILSYFVAGLGVLFLFTACVNTATHWFQKKRSTAIGLMYTGSGIGGIVIPIMLRSLFSSLKFGWTIRILGFMGLALIAVPVVIVKDRRKELGLMPTSRKGPFINALKRIDPKVLKDPIFVLFLFAGIGNSTPFFLTTNNIVSYATANGWSAHLAYYLLVAYNVASTIGRVSGGYLSDRYGRFNFFILCNVIATVGIVACWLPSQAGHSKPGLFIYSVLGGFASGSYFQSSPSCVAQISTAQTFSARYGTFSFIVSTCNFVILPIGGAIIQAGTGPHDDKGRGYDRLVILVALLLMVGVVFSTLTRIRIAGWRRAIV